MGLPVKAKSEDFYFPLTEAPELVRIDPGVTVLSTITFRPPAAMLAAQLADQEDVVGRLLAVEQLQEKRDDASLARLKKVLNEDPFWAVRIAASKALRAAHTDAAFESLSASMTQTNARVRRQVVVARAPR